MEKFDRNKIKKRQKFRPFAPMVLKEFAKDLIKQQMAQYGQLNPDDKELDGIAARVMSNQDEVKRLQEQLMSKKLVDFYKEHANLKTKELSYDKFVKEVYGA